MKALVYTQPNEIQLLARAYPELIPDEVVLKIEAVGLCGSDMH
ncbi:MAG: galactitol-1-phosphate 5-dehydrogenase, partial [Polynucleobacter sp.]|nr:galactitol-1-phosphate 5-dehydrogenase [Polynucleobacter sp.]